MALVKRLSPVTRPNKSYQTADRQLSVADEAGVSDLVRLHSPLPRANSFDYFTVFAPDPQL